MRDKHNMFLGRHRIVEQLIDKKFSLEIGAKEISHSEITIDIDKSLNPTIVADCRFLPFKSSTFERVFFLDVIEHLLKNSEIKALKEINRVLRYEGELILSTPKHRLIYALTDPAFYILRHRHYTEEQITNLLSECSFKIVKLFTRGGFWQIVFILYCGFFTWKLGLKVPKYLLYKKDLEYDQPTKNGYSIIVKAKKK